MKKIIIPFVAVLSAGALFSCGPSKAEQALQDSLRVADSLHKVDSLRVADSIRVADSTKAADSIKAAEELKKAEEAKAAAQAQKAKAAIAKYRGMLKEVREMKAAGWPGASSSVMRWGDNIQSHYNYCKSLMKYMTPEQQAELKKLDQQMDYEFSTWY